MDTEKKNEENPLPSSTSDEANIGTLGIRAMKSVVAHREAKDLVFKKIIENPKERTKMLNEIFGPELKQHFKDDNFILKEKDYEVITLKSNSKSEIRNDFAAIVLKEYLLFLEAMSTFSPTKDLKRFFSYFIKTLIYLLEDKKVPVEDLMEMKTKFGMLYTGPKNLDKRYTFSFGPSFDFHVYPITKSDDFSDGDTTKGYMSFCDIQSGLYSSDKSPEVLAEEILTKCRQDGILSEILTDQFRRLMEDMYVELQSKTRVPLSPEEYDAAVLEMGKKVLELMEAEEKVRKAEEDLAKDREDLAKDRENLEKDREELEKTREEQEIAQKKLKAEVLIKTCLTLKTPEDSIIELLVEDQNYSPEEAEAFFANYMSEKDS